jgi:hypothetical protein
MSGMEGESWGPKYSIQVVTIEVLQGSMELIGVELGPGVLLHGMCRRN